MSLRTILAAMLAIFSCLVPAIGKDIDYDAMYSNCLSAAGGVNNAVVHACASDTSAEVKLEIIRLYKKIISSYKSSAPEDAALFEQTQRAWIKYRNGQCKLAGSYVGSPMVSFCPMMLNIARLQELRELAGD